MENWQQIATVFVRHGAGQAQAETMARQLTRRAGQLAKERGTTEVEELRQLLNASIRGAKGENPYDSA